MKKIKWALSIFVVLNIVVVISRLYFIDYIVVGNDKFAPDLNEGDFNLVCKFCNSYKSGDYILSETKSNNLKLYKIESVIDNETLNVSDSKNLIKLRVSEVSGKLF